MAWTEPTTRSTGDLITAAIWNTDVVDNLDYLYEHNFKAAYDSGWFAVTYNTTYTKAHGLGAAPRLAIVLHALVAAPGTTDRVFPVEVVTHGSVQRSIAEADATDVVLKTGDSSATGTLCAVNRSSGGGYYRLLAFK